MADRHWKTLSRTSVFSGGPIRTVSVESVELPDGRVIPDYYRIEMADYVLVYAELADGRVPLFRHYRHGVGRVCLTFPGGVMEPGESPAAAAERELREELGLAAHTWTALGSFVTNPNQRCNVAHLFKATGCTRVEEPDSGDLEDSTVEYWSREALLEPGRLADIGLTSHALLACLGTAGA